MNPSHHGKVTPVVKVPSFSYESIIPFFIWATSRASNTPLGPFSRQAGGLIVAGQVNGGPPREGQTVMAPRSPPEPLCLRVEKENPSKEHVTCSQRVTSPKKPCKTVCPPGCPTVDRVLAPPGPAPRAQEGTGTPRPPLTDGPPAEPGNSLSPRASPKPKGGAETTGARRPTWGDLGPPKAFPPSQGTCKPKGFDNASQMVDIGAPSKIGCQWGLPFQR
ncbi:basic salivary proline-rich protein 2-like [Penaeus monodon]|uniref:basic salivary proline-rich protein 2-like n=1 Tax=Penaeus monodon TaxID=6687 RepID=UPI0018A6FED7|nr:basic salivary proline-rich protein 2-like [Penaeus monodon]